MPDTAFLHPSPTRAGISCQQIFLNVKYRRYRSVGTEGSSVGKAPSPPLSRRYGHQTIDTYKARKKHFTEKTTHDVIAPKQKRGYQRVGTSTSLRARTPKGQNIPFRLRSLLKKTHAQKCSPRFSRFTPLDIPRASRAACVSYTTQLSDYLPNKKGACIRCH